MAKSKVLLMPHKHTRWHGFRFYSPLPDTSLH